MEDNKIAAASSTSEKQSQQDEPEKNVYTKDEYHLAKLGYKQEFVRGLGLFENWASTFTCMNFVSGIPVLFGFAMVTGGPTAAFANWTMVGGFSFIVSLSMAELAASLPTAGGIYYWSYVLGGSEWGPFLSWMTGWWNWAGWVTVIPGVQQGATNFLLSALEIQYPNAAILDKGWFAWILTTVGLLFSMAPNIYNQKVLQWYFRFAIVVLHALLVIYWIWFPISASSKGGFHNSDGVFRHFHNGINEGTEKKASDAYCWIVGMLFGAWVFYGEDSSVHLAEETKGASEIVAKGMWMSTLSAWLMSIPTLMIILFCLQDFDGIISATFTNNWAEYLVQLVGKRGAVGILGLLWLDGTCATASAFMSAQRVTYAISRDGLLPFSKYFATLSKRNRMPINSALLCYVIAVALTCAVIGSTVAFTAITATATITTNFSYLIPILAKQTVGRASFQPAAWNLGRYSMFCATVSCFWISFLVVILLLPQVYPITAQTLNYAPIMIGAITLISLVGWILPWGYGGRSWFKGPIRTINDEDLTGARVEDDIEK